MRSIIAVLGLALLVASPAVRSASPARSALGDCRNVEVFMGEPVEISTGPVQVPQCVDDNEDTCVIWGLWCDDPEILQRESIALASCSLSGDVVPPLRFSVESSLESVDFVPPFSGVLACGFDGSHRMNRAEFESQLPKETARRYPCEGEPQPTLISGRTRVRCIEKP